MLQDPAMAKLPLFTAPQATAEGALHWFVYGSSLDGAAFAGWCAEHGYRAPDLSRAWAARMDGKRLVFNVRSNFWGGLVGSLVDDPASHVEGIALPLPAEALGLVRHKEGVLSGLFEERRGPASPLGTVAAAGAQAHRSPVECHYYVAAASRTVPEGRPAPRFLETLLRGSRERGLSAEWIARLEAAG